jgi:hypothetical protein
MNRQMKRILQPKETQSLNDSNDKRNGMSRFGESAYRWCQTSASACVTILFRTRVDLWEKVAFSGRPSWDERNVVIAEMIPPGSSVLDVGCGAQTLRQHLRADCTYQPSDIIKSTPDVIVCDLNAGIYPRTKELFDYVVCSGVLEYVRKPKEFLHKIPRLGRTVILSYNPLPDGGSKLERLGNGWGWVNHFKRHELEDLFRKVGLRWSLVHESTLHYVIYSLQLEGNAA